MPEALAALIKNPDRIAAVHDAGLLDTAPEEAFDQLARLAAMLVDAPIALVSLVDGDRQFFKSCIGDLPHPWGSERQTPLSHSFCQHVVASKKPLIIEDAREHPLVKDNLAILDLGVIAYLGIPLFNPEGLALGTLCVMDAKPRQWTELQIETLRSLAGAVMTTISLRSEARAANRLRVGERGTADAGDAKSTGKAVHDAANALSEIASRFLSCLDDYDFWIRNHEPTPDMFKEETERRERILAVENEAKNAVQRFQERLEQSGRGQDPAIQSALDLWQACNGYFEAEARRQGASKRFQQLRTALDEVEREALLASRAEQALRRAAHAYELRGE